jgi:hypothetical protein
MAIADIVRRTAITISNSRTVNPRLLLFLER